MQRQRGSTYIEVVIAVSLITIIAGLMAEKLPSFLSNISGMRTQSKLIMLSDYVGNYVERWAGFDPNTAKAKLISDYSDGDEIESERRINRLLWADPLTNTVANEYKVSMKLQEVSSRNDSAVVQIIVWYDQNLDDVVDSTERKVQFSTIVTEKANP